MMESLGSVSYFAIRCIREQDFRRPTKQFHTTGPYHCSAVFSRVFYYNHLPPLRTPNLPKKNHKSNPGILPNQIGNPLPNGKTGYFWLSSQPLHILIFLFPLIIFHELGTMGIIGSEVASKLEAQELLVRFFDLFGVLGLHLPAAVLVLTLLIQQTLSRVPWKIVPIVPLAMIAESAFLTGPLVILAIILEPQTSSVVIAPAAQLAGSEPGSFWNGLYLAIGAGLYEEMLFRLVLITMLHFIISDVLSFRDKTGKIAAVIIAAIAFAWLHDAVYDAASGLNLRLALFYTLAGCYFGTLFLMRGFGIAVGVHTMYDLLVFVIMPGIQESA